jgi:hypothetical protein
MGNDADADRIAKEIKTAKDISVSSSPKITKTYKLIFTFDNKEYLTFLTFKKDKVYNNCIRIRYNATIGSKISSNTAEKQCFAPMLKTDLPKGVTQTDILQVLTTKLKFILFANKASTRPIPKGVIPVSRGPITEETELLDMAQLQKSSDETYVAGFSAWRLLNGLSPIYEKYGYVSEDSNNVQKLLKTLTWGSIKDKPIFPQVTKEDIAKHAFDEPITVDALLTTFYPEIKAAKNDDMLVTEVMEKIPYINTEISSLNVDADREGGENDSKRTIVDFVINVIYKIVQSVDRVDKGELQPILFRVQKDGITWKMWDERLIFTSFNLVDDSPGAASGGAGGGGGAASGGAGGGGQTRTVGGRRSRSYRNKKYKTTRRCRQRSL